jgi:hypothetical protein
MEHFNLFCAAALVTKRKSFITSAPGHNLGYVEASQKGDWDDAGISKTNIEILENFAISA